MPVIDLVTRIAAPIERVFDLARSIDAHVASTSSSGERAVAGVTSGLIGLGEEVTWRARHFGVWQTLTVRITEFERPSHFADTMLRGAFKRMEHHHRFEESAGATTMRDVFDYASPLGWLGRIADAVIVERHLRALLVTRNRILASTAESSEWRRYLIPPDHLP